MKNNQSPPKIKNIFKNMFTAVNPDELIAQGKKTELSKTLTVFDLIILFYYKNFINCYRSL